MNRLAGGGIAVALALALTALTLSATPARGALERPSYTVGDRWVYILESGVEGLPGLNETTNVTLEMSMAGQVEVQVVGFEDVAVGTETIRAVRVDTSTTAFLSGTITLPGFPSPATISGSVSSDVSELWEDQGYLAIESVGTSELLMEVNVIVPTRFEMTTRFAANSTVVQTSPFPLDVGNTTSADLTTDLWLNMTITVQGMITSFENRTVFPSLWTREVEALESVRVEAGTFSAYRLNQTLGAIPGLSLFTAPPGNETAHFSNDVGYYVQRVQYANGTPVAEMRLKSYRFGPQGPSSVVVGIGIALAVVAAVAIAALLIRRRRRKPALDLGSSAEARGTTPEAGPAEVGHAR